MLLLLLLLLLFFSRVAWAARVGRRERERVGYSGLVLDPVRGSAHIVEPTQTEKGACVRRRETGGDWPV